MSGSTLILAALLGAMPAQADQPDHVVTISERVPFAFLLNTPTGAVANTSSSQLIRTVSDTLRRDTSFQLQLFDGDVVRTCQGRLTCLVLAAREDYERQALERADGTFAPYREHVRRMRDADRSYPRYLLVLSNVSIPDRPDRMSATLIDTDVALEIFHDAPREKEEWEDFVESRISGAAARTPTVRTEIESAVAATEFIERLFRREYVEVLEASGHWRPYGSIDLVSNVEGLEIALDGRTVATTVPGVTRLARVLPGTRAITARHPGYTAVETTALVRRGEVARVELAPVGLASGASEGDRTALLVTGGVTAAVGAGLLVWSASRADGNVRTLCFDEPCLSGRFQTIGYDPEADFGAADDVNPNGLLVAPLGAALVGMGASFAIGALLTEDASPWWSVLSGVVVGGAIYGTAAALH